MNDLAPILERHVEYLASRELAGRAPGTPGGLLARAYVEQAFSELDLIPRGTEGYAQPIPAIGGANLIGEIPAGRPASTTSILIGAHYDHLGMLGDRIFPGADDNGSGVAVLLEVARQLSSRRDELGRNVVVFSFDAEEPPYFRTPEMGSIYFVENPCLPLDQVGLMICLDLVGHALGSPDLPDQVRQSILVSGAERSSEVDTLVDRLADQTPGILPRRIDSDLVPPVSDHASFEEVGIPSLFYNCLRTRRYHTPRDTPDGLDYHKLAGLVQHITELVVQLGAVEQFTYDESAIDDVASMKTLSELARPLLPTMRKPERVEMLMERISLRIAQGEQLTERDRSGLMALLGVTEGALAS